MLVEFNIPLIPTTPAWRLVNAGVILGTDSKDVQVRTQGNTMIVQADIGADVEMVALRMRKILDVPQLSLRIHSMRIGTIIGEDAPLFDNSKFIPFDVAEHQHE